MKREARTTLSVRDALTVAANYGEEAANVVGLLVSASADGLVLVDSLRDLETGDEILIAGGDRDLIELLVVQGVPTIGGLYAVCHKAVVAGRLSRRDPADSQWALIDVRSLTVRSREKSYVVQL